MKKRDYLRVLSILIMSSLFVSCSDKSIEKNSEASPAVSESDKNDINQEENDGDMISRALVRTGNTNRIKKVIERARDGEKLKFGYIGGSITEGSSAGSQKCYATLSSAGFGEKFGCEVECINAGISGTPSILGNVRVQRDILDHKPDVIFLEFAVNDSSNEADMLSRGSYESLLRTCLEAENEPAVIILISCQENGYSCEEHMTALGEHYDLPVISTGKAVFPEIKNGNMTWKDFSDDTVHPNVYGHGIFKDMIMHYFNMADKSEKDGEFTINDTPLYNADYQGAVYLDASNLEGYDAGSFDLGTSNKFFQSGWAYKGTGDNKPLKFKIKARKLLMIYRTDNKEVLGALSVNINGERVKVVSAYDRNGWGGPVIVQIYDGTEPADLEVEMMMLNDHKDKFFDILGFGCVE